MVQYYDQILTGAIKLFWVFIDEVHEFQALIEVWVENEVEGYATS